MRQKFLDFEIVARRKLVMHTRFKIIQHSCNAHSISVSVSVSVLVPVSFDLVHSMERAMIKCFKFLPYFVIEHHYFFHHKKCISKMEKVESCSLETSSSLSLSLSLRLHFLVVVISFSSSGFIFNLVCVNNKSLPLILEQEIPFICTQI